MDPILLKFRDKFFDEANGLLDQMEKDILELEKDPDNKNLIESAFRAMHTIKGVSGMYGFEFICEFTHIMESIYQAIREGKLKFNKEIFDITFCSLDHIRKLLSDEKLSDQTNRVNHNQLMNDINTIMDSISENKMKEEAQKIEKEETLKPAKTATWHILLKTDEKIYFRGISLLNIFKELSDLGRFQISRLDYLSDTSYDMWSVILTSDSSKDEIDGVFMFIEDNYFISKISEINIFEAAEKASEQRVHEQSIIDYVEHSGINTGEKKSSKPKLIEESNNVTGDKHIKRISVDSEKLDNLMFLVSELITVNSQLNLYTNSAIFSSIRPYLEKVDVLSKQFRNTALEIRLVPLSDLVLRFQRLIRDLSKHLNKKVELVTQGIDTELDKNTIDQLSDPLMHIIRNCIDHGIELPEIRKNQGKPETGHIKISACHSGNYIIIKVEDDGSGINHEKIRLKAIEKGILKQSDNPTIKELNDFIFLPGFSTAQNLTEVSGRGVGMDVVKKKILDLRGDVTVETTEGIGTSFTLKLQQSVTIIDTLLFKVEDCNFIVPISEIRICSQIDFDEIESRKHTSTIPFHDRLIPFIDLREKLHIGGHYNAKIKLIILGTDDKIIALLTDTIVGEHQAVLKPLGKSFRQQNFLTSASQLGNGKLALMIDTNNIFKSVDRTNTSVLKSA